MPRTVPDPVQAYLAALPAPARKVVREVLATVREAVPGAEEGISYQIPVVRLGGRMVLYVAAFAEHWSIYPATPGALAALGDAARKHLHGKATLRFPYGAAVPVRLVTRFARARAEETASRPGRSPRTRKVKPGGATGPADAAAAYLASLPEPRRSELAHIDRFIRATLPALERGFASGMIGYGPFRYRYASGREGDTFKIMLSSRARYVALYACAADARGYVAERYRARLPAADIGKSCVRFSRFEDLDPGAVRDLLLEAQATGYGV